MKTMRHLFALLCLTLAVSAEGAAASITSASPNPIDAGGPAVTLTVNLTAFVTGAKINWAGTPLATSFVSDTALSATVPAGLIAICGKYAITVTGSDGTVSNSYDVIVRPVLQALSPNVVTAGSGGVTVTARGLGFSNNVFLTLIASGTQINLATSYLGSTVVAGNIPASAFSGTYPVSLFVTDASVGAASQSAPLSIALTFATIGQIRPDSVRAGIIDCNLTSPACFTLNVGGANFAGNAQVLWNGAPLATHFVNNNVLTATVTTALVHDKSVGVGIQVQNPGAAAASNTVKLVILDNPYGSTIFSLSPTSALGGGTAVTLTVTGESFTAGSIVFWQTLALQTRFVSSTQLTATIPASFLVANTTPRITVSTPGVAVSNFVDFPIVVAFPSITSISPTSVAAGGPAFTLTVNGDGFIPTSQVNGLPGATTTYVSRNLLTASVPAGAIANAGSIGIQVANPGALQSQGSFFLTVGGAAPAIDSVSPASILLGGGDFTLTVNGSNFLASASVNWNGTALATTRVNATQLTARVPAALIATAGTARISVVNEGPVASNEVAVTISPTPAATLASLTPGAAAPGGAGFTLTVAGTGFTSNSTVQWNGAALTTTFVSATQLTASVGAAQIAAAGTASVTVAGGGAVSNTLSFTIGAVTPSGTSVVNAASFQPAIAPGALITIFGSNLAGSTAQFSTVPLPVTLGATSVSINGTSVPLLFVSPVQVNAQVPYETKVGTAKLVVQASGVSSAVVNVDVAATGPGVFTKDGHVLALNLADGTTNAAATPARPGQYVTAYLTGQGLVDPPVATGDVAPGSPFARPVALVLVKIGGVAADVQFAGLAPGFVDGLLQMNVLVPDVPAGEQTFDVSVGGVAAASTVISIAARQ